MAVEVALDGFDALYWGFRRLQGSEAWAGRRRADRALQAAARPGRGAAIRLCARGDRREVAEATGVRARFRARLTALLGRDGVLLLPTMPDVAPRLSDSEEALDDYRNDALRLLCLAGLAGFPQVTVPAVLRGGAPLGLSLIGPAGSDLSLVRFAVELGV